MENVINSISQFFIKTWMVVNKFVRYNRVTEILFEAIVIILVALLLYIVTRLIVSKLIKRVFGYIKTKKGRDFKKLYVVLYRASLLVPILFLYSTATRFPEASEWIKKIVLLIVIVVILRVLFAFLSLIEEILITQPKTKDISFKGSIQAINLISVLIGIIFMLSVIIEKSPSGILAGLGAVSAILMLIFKDTILSFVSGIQISMDKRMKIGDWIEVGKFGVDGEIIDITLNNIKVRNWDKTIISVPAFRFLDEPFKNWTGMSESGGRRIKRSILIDQNSVRFATSEDLEAFKKIELVNYYIASKEGEIEASNQKLKVNPELPVNGRQQTNLGIFRAYVESYLNNHPQIIQEGMTLMVRQLSPGATGVPIEIYCFTNTIEWKKYEGIQADIFDHMLAAVEQFGLRVFQSPAGNDFNNTFRN